MELPGEAWIERVRVSTQPEIDLTALPEGEGLGALLSGIRRLRDDREALLDLAGELEDLRKVLPRELVEGDEGLDLREAAAAETLGRVLAGLEDRIVPRLLRSVDTESGARS